MVDIKQRGEPTYKRSHVRWIWTPTRLENDLVDITKVFGKTYFPDLPISNVDVRMYEKWTDLGPHADLTIKLGPNFMIKVGCYHDGWHINLIKTMGRDLDADTKKAIFGDANRNQMWTQETEKVPHMMGELYRELKSYLGEK